MLALCADGGVVAWGYNHRGQLGNASTTNSAAPVDLRQSVGLTGKSVRSIVAGASHSMALCDDGTMVAWGYNHRNQLGLVGVTQSTEPVQTPLPTAMLAGWNGGNAHALIRQADGTLLAWGENAQGQLGDGTLSSRAMPQPADFSVYRSPFVMASAAGASSLHSLAVVATAESQERDLAVEDPMGDPDQDGLPNLVEYAFGLDSHANSAGMLPEGRLSNGELVIRFTQPTGVAGVIYGAEWSETMVDGSWRAVPDSGAGGEHCFAIPVDGKGKAFMRLKVTRDSSPD